MSFTDWTPVGRFETTQGNRCALMVRDNEHAAIMWSYAGSCPPSFTDYERTADARAAFHAMRETSARKAPLVVDWLS